MNKQQQQQLTFIGCAAAISISVLLWHFASSSAASRKKKRLLEKENNDNNDDSDGLDDRTTKTTPSTTTEVAVTPKKKTTSQPPQQSTATATTTTKSTTHAAVVVDTDPTPRRDNTKSAMSTSTTATAATSATTATETNMTHEQLRHAKIEELDTIGKAFFKEKKYLDAAQAFTEALTYLETQPGGNTEAEEIIRTTTSSNNNNNHHGATTATASGSSAVLSNLLRQKVTLLNNRSAMYEKAEVYDLALDDCVQILDYEMTHQKARIRKLRIYELTQQYHPALVEICAIQLLFMQVNRLKLQMNLPVPTPPIPQSKMEDVLNQLLPSETETYVTLLNERNDQQRNQPQSLPGHYTILQLLRSYTEYNTWMALAAKDGSVEILTSKLNISVNNNTTTTTTNTTPILSIPDQALLYYQRGRRYIYDRKYEEASQDFEQAYRLVHDQPLLIASMKEDSYARILEWTGMVRHWHYSLDDALQCLQEAAEIEPNNALLIVKQAGIQLDAGQQEEALTLFERALQIDPNSVDALLHRSNLRIMQNMGALAKTDLETCIKLRPGHTMARLRLASILVPLEDMDGAKRQIDLAEQAEPNSSEVHSYRGELHFAKGEMEEARKAFETAIQLEPFNPTPYVNAAMAIINTPPPPGQMPDTETVVKLLEQAIEVDPQFSAAYVHLGQLKLGTATTLLAAREVIQLYDTALLKCRTPEEIRDLCGMRVLAVAQVEAAEQLKMETFNLN